MIFPKWKNMPKPFSLVTLSWEDIYYTAKFITQEKFQRNPTKVEIRELFDFITSRGMDMDNGTFWDTVEVHCQQHYDEVTQ